MRIVGRSLPLRSGGTGPWPLFILLIALVPTLSPAGNVPDPPGDNSSQSPQAEPPALIVRLVSINGGGGESSDGTLVIRGTLGQPSAGDTATCQQTITSEQWSMSTETDPGRIWRSGFEFSPLCE